jgi:16S rRNA (guanine527-N7)-methyltransferase
LDGAITAIAADDLRRWASDVGASLDGGAMGRLEKFIALLTLWNRRIRLTGDRDPTLLVSKHVVDSLAVLPEIAASGMVVDIGSGGGFPGIVLGCARPDLPLRLIESRRRPTSFLSEAIRTIPLPDAKALEMRAEDAASDPSLAGRASVVVSRALRLDLLVDVGAPLLAPGGSLIAMQTLSMGSAPAATVERRSGLNLRRTRDYRLPGGEPRRLLILARS